MNTESLLLHDTARAHLEQFFAAPAHAVLLSGPKGIGKSQIAALLAAELLAVSRDSLNNAAYYKHLAPKDGSISIELIRGLIGFFRLKVPGNKTVQRVAVIEDADNMGHEAQNALLKILEEPPVDSVLILTSSQEGRLLATIRSRTTLLKLPAPTTTSIQTYFEKAGYDKPAVQSAVLRSGTNIAEAYTILNGANDDQNSSIALVKQVLAGTGYDRLLLVDGLSKQKEQARAFVDDLASVATASLEAAARKNAASASRWQDVLQAAHTAQEAFEQNGNAKLVLSELMLSL
jgi:replication-associated recombination protein RarA